MSALLLSPEEQKTLWNNPLLTETVGEAMDRLVKAQYDKVLQELKRIDFEELNYLTTGSLRAITAYEEKIRALIDRMEQK